MASRTSFKPKASSNIIEGATPVEEVVTPVEQEEVVEATSEPAVLETTEVPDSKNEKVTFEDKSTKTPIEKNVKIRTRVNHTCSIGGVRYHFEKGKLTNVPESVKAILLQADLLMPL